MAGRNSEKDFLGTGVKFPIRVDPMTGRLETVSYEDDIKEAIYLILMTRKGERLMRPEFGCEIHKFIFGTADYASLSQMEKAVEDALLRWEPRIEQIEVSAALDESDSSRVLISIHYVVRSTNNPYNLVFPFYINEGME